MLMKTPYDRKELDEKCIENYDAIKDVDILWQVQNFLRTNPQPEGFDALFLKRITKIASYALSPELKLAADYDKRDFEIAYNYCIEAAQKIEEGKIAEAELLRFRKMHGHLYSHAASFMREIARQENNDDKKLEALIKSYEGHRKSIPLGMDAEDYEHVTYEHGLAANVASEIARIVPLHQQKTWIIRAAGDFLETAARSESINKEHSMITYSILADLEYELTLISGNSDEQTEYARRAIMHAKKSTEMAEKLNEKHYAFTCLNIGKFASLLYDLTNNPDDCGEAIKHYQIIRDYCIRNPASEYLQIIKMANANIERLRESLKESRHGTPEKKNGKKQRDKKNSHLHREINEELSDYLE